MAACGGHDKLFGLFFMKIVIAIICALEILNELFANKRSNCGILFE
jgi:hypothetical protein